MSERQKQPERDEVKATKKARWLLEGSHGMTRDAARLKQGKDDAGPVTITSRE